MTRQTAPTVDPDLGTQISVSFAAEWLPYLLACLRPLTSGLYWTGTEAEIGAAIQRSQLLIDLIARPQATEGETLPTGAIIPFPVATPPDGWLVCDGSAVSRATYSALFTLIGTTYGAGNGTTTFNLPDLRGRFPMGVSGSHALATTGGAETHTLDITEIPAHNHNIETYTSGGAVESVQRLTTGNAHATNTTAIANKGGGGAHSILNPFLALHFIIKT